MRIKDLLAVLESWAPRALQEDYDNSGLHTGDPEAEVTAAMVCLDCTEQVVEEAAAKGCGLIISHHPVIFKGLKSLAGGGPVERTVLAAIRHGIALYAIHTNLDNVIDGVNGEIAARLGLAGRRVLEARAGQLAKLVVFVPQAHAEGVRRALFAAGAGRIGAYDECSYNLEGQGTFRPGEGSNAYVGRRGERHVEPETRVEVVVPRTREAAAVAAMRAAHPYEEVAFDLVPLANAHPGIGSGLVGEWGEAMAEAEVLARAKAVFGQQVLRHSPLIGRPVRRVAVCGGAGAFLIGRALAAGADAYITADLKYHDYFQADGRMLLIDVGHYGSEQFTMGLIQRRLGEVFPTFAVRLTETVTDPIHYS
ncbi:MAG: Nif3-like dinuclear metal center hexameric protein [Flavobacteriales bacterium]|nr:GTP cyclohydrolase 1 type 2 [Flavobacteriales bacterium]MCC6576814.1 Nif3-like dinuclear metal center hexameric protein [Flavobacteriales bacterium]NUQ16680.1 Nif3-like dinuclear metal center hexameric protein [Flavobacteriales bacterium]